MSDADWSGKDPPPGYEAPTPPDTTPRRVDRVPDDFAASDVEARYHSPDSGPGVEAEADDDDDMLDGMCDLDFEMAPRTDDADIDALVLFADTQFDDPEAVEAKAAAWRELGGE